jgi:hypothetical protein
VNFIYSELGVNTSERLSLEQVMKAAIETNAITEYFNLEKEETLQNSLDNIVSSLAYK